MKKEKTGSTGKLTTALLIVALTAFLLASLYGLYRIDLITLPSFITDFLTREKEPPDDGQGNDLLREFLDSLSSGETDNRFVTLDNVDMKQIFATSTVSKAYMHEFSITYTYGQRVFTQTYSAVRYGEKFNIKVFEDDIFVKSVVCDGENILIRDETSGTQVITEADELSYEGETSTASVDLITNIVINFDGTPLDSAYGKVYDSEVFFTRHPSGNTASITITYDQNAETYDRYYLDLEDGYFLMAKSYRNGELFLEMTTLKFSSDLSGFDLNQLFTVPVK